MRRSIWLDISEFIWKSEWDFGDAADEIWSDFDIVLDEETDFTTETYERSITNIAVPANSNKAIIV